MDGENISAKRYFYTRQCCCVRNFVSSPTSKRNELPAYCALDFKKCLYSIETLNM